MGVNSLACTLSTHLRTAGAPTHPPFSLLSQRMKRP